MISSATDSSGRISKWVMELSEYVVDFDKRSVIKSHIQADFIAEWMKVSSSAGGIALESPWLIYCDGSCGHTGQLEY
jgi:hypothetical protein